MKDEIKEILDKLKSNNYPFGLATIDINKLEDYITNLQIELNTCMIERNQYLSIKEHLEQENKILKENAIHNDKVVDKARWNEMIYKQRNEKAIEKLESIRIFGLRSGKNLFSTLINETIDILNGGDDNE